MPLPPLKEIEEPRTGYTITFIESIDIHNDIETFLNVKSMIIYLDNIYDVIESLEDVYQINDDNIQSITKIN